MALGTILIANFHGAPEPRFPQPFRCHNFYDSQWSRFLTSRPGIFYGQDVPGPGSDRIPMVRILWVINSTIGWVGVI